MANPESDNISQLEANFFKWLDADNQMKPFASIVRKKINESKGLFRLELLQFCASTAGRLIGLKGERERFEALSRNASWLERIIDHRDPKQRYRFLKELLELPTKALAEGLSQFKGGSQANTRGMLSWILLTRLESQGLLSGHVTVQKKERGKVRSEEVPKKTKVLEFVKSNTYSDRIEVRNLYHFLLSLLSSHLTFFLIKIFPFDFFSTFPMMLAFSIPAAFSREMTMSACWLFTAINSPPDVWGSYRTASHSELTLSDIFTYREAYSLLRSTAPEIKSFWIKWKTSSKTGILSTKTSAVTPL